MVQVKQSAVYSVCLEPTVAGTISVCIQAPAQDPPVAALDYGAGCSRGCRVPSSGAVVSLATVSEFGADYKIVLTRLNSIHSIKPELRNLSKRRQRSHADEQKA